MDDLEKYRDLLNHDTDGVNDEMSEFLSKSANARIPQSRSKEEIWSEIEKGLEEEDKQSSIPIWTYAGIAASLLLIAIFVFTLRNPVSATIITKEALVAETKVVDLPDGSVVTLNANSSLSFSEEWNRKVDLKGEAFFEVTEGGKFAVSTSIGSVEVLGTSFNVFVRDSTFEVACKTGKVRVEIPAQTISELITPGTSIRLESDTVLITTLDTDLVGRWKAGVFYFSDQKLSDVILEVERQFGVEIQITDATDYIFNGYFTNKSVENALEMVCLPLGLSYEKTSRNTYAIKESE